MATCNTCFVLVHLKVSAYLWVLCPPCGPRGCERVAVQMLCAHTLLHWFVRNDCKSDGVPSHSCGHQPWGSAGIERMGKEQRLRRVLCANTKATALHPWKFGDRSTRDKAD
jgi:hypothetical protein